MRRIIIEFDSDITSMQITLKQESLGEFSYKERDLADLAVPEMLKLLTKLVRIADSNGIKTTTKKEQYEERN